MSTDTEIEKTIEERGLTAPRVSPADVQAAIANEYFFTAADGFRACEAHRGVFEPPSIPQSMSLLTICVLVLRNGFTVVGTSACASPENFDAEIGCKVARTKAVEQIWPLLGYSLRDRLNG
jgi:hypothetical protein